MDASGIVSLRVVSLSLVAAVWSLAKNDDTMIEADGWLVE